MIVLFHDAILLSCMRLCPWSFQVITEAARPLNTRQTLLIEFPFHSFIFISNTEKVIIEPIIAHDPPNKFFFGLCHHRDFSISLTLQLSETVTWIFDIIL